MRRVTRRNFIRTSGKGLAGAALGGAALKGLIPGSVLGANERPRIGVIGCGGRGAYVTRGLAEAGAEIAYLCDLRGSKMEQTARLLADVQPRKPRQVTEMARLLDDPNLDAVAVATPDHWHALATIRACQAGKDVYVEKPHSHNIWESQQMVAAARKHGRVVQVGTQCRSAPYVHAAREYIKSGDLGGIHLVKVYNLKSDRSFKLGAPGKQPDDFNWDAWLGPAPTRPYHQQLVGSGWQQYWDFNGGGMMGDGIHQWDLALLLLGNPGMPKAVSASGGRLAHKDDSEVPDLLVASFDYDGFVMTMEHSEYPKYMQKTTATIRRNDEFPYWTQNATRIELYGSELMMTVGRHGGGWQVTQSGGRVVKQQYGRVPDEFHYQNFLACVKSRKPPSAAVEVLHPSITALHLANIAHRVGNKKLEFDARAGRCTNNADANKLLKRAGRAPYTIPESV